MQRALSSQPGAGIPAPPPVTEYRSGRVKTVGGEVIDFGRCLYNLQATPSGMVLSVIMRDSTHGREPGDIFIVPFSQVAFCHFEASALPGLIS